MVTYADTALVVTSDHVFLLSDGGLKTADRLSPHDSLVAPDGSAVKINSVHIGDYIAGFHHIATKKSPPDANLSDHLLNTNGVVSGDYTLQIFYKASELTPFLVQGHEKLPIVGSAEYRALYGGDCLKAPDAKFISSRFEVAKQNTSDLLPRQFIPASALTLQIPPNAASFISDQEAQQKAADPKRDFNDPAAREWTESLINYYQNFFPGVVFQFDWASDVVNAYAWVQNGVRYVAILGGLVRHWSLELEGIGLVLSHELGHHYGGPPTFPGGLSCEGQADYYGVLVNMRKVWFGQQYLTVTDAAIAQMANFFGVPNSPNVPGGNAGCNHPPGQCRIATYYAALNLEPKPGCAS